MKRFIIWKDKIFNRRDGLAMFGMAMGKFRVKYPDGKISVWMPYNEAQNMQGCYGGVIQHRLEAQDEGD